MGLSWLMIISLYERTDEGPYSYRRGKSFVFDKAADTAQLVADAVLPDGRYRCQLVLTDLLGRQVRSAYCEYEVTDGAARPR